MDPSGAAQAERKRTRGDTFLDRLVDAGLGMMDVLAIYIGDRLGLYEALKQGGLVTSAQLAGATNTHERYMREWLEQQAVSGILEVDDAAASPMERRYRLPAEHADALTDGDSLRYFAATLRTLVGSALTLPSLLTAFRTGGGVPYAAYGADIRDGIAAANRPIFLQLLGTEWFPGISDIHARLHGDPPARIADVACGSGWSSIALARAYPRVTIDAFDLDKASVERARENVAAEGLADRIHVHHSDAVDPTLAHGYDLVTVFEALHDIARPVEALAAMRHLVVEGGSVIVADERVAVTFTAPGDRIERLSYGFSILHCLPASMTDSASAGTGAAMRPDTLRRYAADAGFRTVEILPIENDYWRFYRLLA